MSQQKHSGKKLRRCGKGRNAQNVRTYANVQERRKIRREKYPHDTDSLSRAKRWLVPPGIKR